MGHWTLGIGHWALGMGENEKLLLSPLLPAQEPIPHPPMPHALIHTSLHL